MSRSNVSVVYASSITFTAPISLSIGGQSPSTMACETMFAPRRCMKPKPLLPMQQTSTSSPWPLPFLVLPGREPLHVGVEPAAQSPVAGDENHADALHRIAFDEEGV